MATRSDQSKSTRSNSAFLGMCLFALCGSIFPGENAMSIEMPKYTVVYSDGDVEYRQYEPYLVAETTVEENGRYSDAGNEGFRRLFRYITGSNSSQSKIAMTAPVEQGQRGEKISMTAPVEQGRSANGWVVSFMVPSKYDLDTVPEPTDSRVRIRLVPGELRAVLRYSGRWTDKLYARKREELLETLKASEVDRLGEPQSALYNPPYMPPFMRRNEVQVRVANLPETDDLRLAESAAAIGLN